MKLTGILNEFARRLGTRKQPKFRVRALSDHPRPALVPIPISVSVPKREDLRLRA